jgi:hypothetical protein
MGPGSASDLQDETLVEREHGGKTEEETETPTSRRERSPKAVIGPWKCAGNRYVSGEKLRKYR